MLEIAPNSFLVKSKIIGMKIVSKDARHWVVFNCGKIEKEAQEIFSAPHESQEAAKAFLDACAQSL